MSDILLVNPPGQRKAIEISAPPHLGIAALTASAEAAGYSVSVLDYGFARYDGSRLSEVLRAGRPKVIGVSVVSPALREVSAIASDVRRIAPDAALVLGGPHVSADSGILSELSIDYGFAGEADRGFTRLCDHLIRGEGGLSGIPGLVYKNGGLWETNEQDYIENLDDLPDPLIGPRTLSAKGLVPVSTSRGCPFSCSYCAQGGGGKVRFRSPQRVVGEVARLSRELKTRLFAFVDDVFTLDRGRTLELCRLLSEKTPAVRWSAITRADCVDRELLSAMKKAGCFHLSFGVESGVEEIRYQLGKKVSNEDYVSAFGWCRQLGIRSCAYAMYGLPGEQWGDMEETTRFVKSLKPTYGFFASTILMPGSALFKQALVEGKVQEGAWIDFMRGLCGQPKYAPDGLSLDDVEFARRLAVQSFYLSPGFAVEHVKSGCGFFETLGLMRLARESQDMFS